MKWLVKYGRSEHVFGFYLQIECLISLRMNKYLLFWVSWYHSWRCECFGLILILNMHILRSMDGCFIVTQAPLATRSYQKKTPSNKYLNVKAGGWNGQCHSMRFSFECFLSLLGMENSAKCSYFTTGHFVSTLPKYLQPGLVIDAIINFAMSRNKSYYIIGKTYVKCKCLVFISICLYTDLDYKVGIYKN